MDIVFRILNMYLLFMVGRMIFNLIISAKNQSSKSKRSREESPQSINPNNWNARVNKIKEEINVYETVKDEVCDTFLQKNQAYIAVEDDKNHYFCSWECRQKYIDEKKKLSNKTN